MLVAQIRSWRATEVKGPPLILNHATNRTSVGGAVFCLLGRDLFLHPKTFPPPSVFSFQPWQEFVHRLDQEGGTTAQLKGHLLHSHSPWATVL